MGANRLFGPAVLADQRHELAGVECACVLLGAVLEDQQQVLLCLDQLNPLEYQDQGHWFELMQSIHYASGGDPEVKAVFQSWSAEDQNYAADGEIVSLRWDSLNENVEGGVGVGTLFKHVGDAGGTPYLPAAMVFQPSFSAARAIARLNL